MCRDTRCLCFVIMTAWLTHPLLTRPLSPSASHGPRPAPCWRDRAGREAPPWSCCSWSWGSESWLDTLLHWTGRSMSRQLNRMIESLMDIIIVFCQICFWQVFYIELEFYSVFFTGLSQRLYTDFFTPFTAWKRSAWRDDLQLVELMISNGIQLS